MLVTLEGIDGSGKTTVARALAGSYPEATHTAEPTETWYGDAVRRSVNDVDADPVAELFLYTADHAAHLARTVRPALDRGELVISDRYSDSRFAYQAATIDAWMDQPLAYIREIHDPFTRPPDATLYFDIDVETAITRAGGSNKFERPEYLERVRGNYERLIAAEPDRFVRIDANQPVDDVIAAGEQAIDERRE